MEKARLIFIVLLLLTIPLVLLVGCTVKVKDYPVIKDPNYPRTVVVEKKTAVGKEKPPSVRPELKKEKILTGVFYPDPTRILIENRTYNVFIRVWLVPSFEGGRVKGSPDFDLPPNAKVEVTMPLGRHPVYARGRIKTREYGWQSVGVVSKEVSISSMVYYGSSYGDYVIFCQSDFPR